MKTYNYSQRQAIQDSENNAFQIAILVAATFTTIATVYTLLHLVTSF